MISAVPIDDSQAIRRDAHLAHEVWMQQTREQSAAYNQAGGELAKTLYDVLTERLWERLGFRSFPSFVSVEMGIRPNDALKLVRMYRPRR